MADRDSQLTLSYQLDKAKAQQVLKSIQDLRSSVRDQAAEIKRLSVSSSGLGNDYGKLSAKATEARNNLLKGTAAMKEQITVAGRLAQAGTSGGGGGGGSTPRIGRTIGTVGSVLSGTGLGDIGGAASQIGRVTNVLQELQSVSGSTVGPLSAAVGSVGSMAIAAPLAGVAVIALTIAVQKFAEDMEANKKRIENAIGSQKTYYEALQTGTTESINLQLKELVVKQAVAVAVRRDIQAGQDQLKQFGILQGLAEQFTGMKDQAKAADDELAQNQAQIDGLTKALGSLQVKTNDAKAAAEAFAGSFSSGPTLAAQIEAAGQQITQTNQQIVQAQAQAAEQEANILQRASDQHIAIAQREAQAEQAALVSLQRSQAEDRIKLGQQEADDRLNFQREEAQSAKQHQANLLKIRKDAENNEFELILNRDFAGLAASRRQTEQRLQEEDVRYKDEREQRLVQLKQKLKDDNTAFIREREAKLRAYNQQLADLRANQIRELKQNDDAARLEITRLNEKLKAEVTAKAQAVDALVAQEQRLNTIRGQLLAGLISAAQAAAQVAGGGTPSTAVYNSKGEIAHHYAGGGALAAGKTGIVNDAYPGQREIFRAGGQSMILPGGMGLFKPFKSGQVETGGGGGGISIGDIHAYGSNPRQTAKIAGKIVEQKLIEAFEELTA